MADTSYLSHEVRKYIQVELGKTYGQEFKRRKLGVRTGGIRSFDCVSEDGTIVGELKTSSGKTSSGKYPSGKVFSTNSDLYYLSLLDIPTRLLILTDREFYEIYTKKIQGFLVPGIDIVLIELPEEMNDEIRKIMREASKEVGGGITVSKHPCCDMAMGLYQTLPGTRD